MPLFSHKLKFPTAAVYFWTVSEMSRYLKLLETKQFQWGEWWEEKSHRLQVHQSVVCNLLPCTLKELDTLKLQLSQLGEVTETRLNKGRTCRQAFKSQSSLRPRLFVTQRSDLNMASGKPLGPSTSQSWSWGIMFPAWLLPTPGPVWGLLFLGSVIVAHA